MHTLTIDCHEIGSPAASKHTANLEEIERGRFIVEERGSDSKRNPNRYCTLGMFLPVDGVWASLHTWSGSNK